MPLPDDRRARSCLVFGLFTVTALAAQLALHFIKAADALAGQPGHGLVVLKATLFCIASGVLAALVAATLARLWRPAAAR